MTPGRNEAAERAAIAALLGYQPPEDRARLLLLVDQADFYDRALASIRRAIGVVHDRGDDVTPVTVCDALAGDRLQARAVPLVRELFFQGDVVGGETHLRIVRRDAIKRRLDVAGRDLIAAIADDAQVDPILDRIDELLGQQSHGVDPARFGIVSLHEVDDDDEIVPTIMRVENGDPLLYEGYAHTFVAPAATGKTFLALVACLAYLRTAR